MQCIAYLYPCTHHLNPCIYQYNVHDVHVRHCCSSLCYCICYTHLHVHLVTGQSHSTVLVVRSSTKTSQAWHMQSAACLWPYHRPAGNTSNALRASSRWSGQSGHLQAVNMVLHQQITSERKTQDKLRCSRQPGHERGQTPCVRNILGLH